MEENSLLFRLSNWQYCSLYSVILLEMIWLISNHSFSLRFLRISVHSFMKIPRLLRENTYNLLIEKRKASSSRFKKWEKPEKEAQLPVKYLVIVQCMIL